MRSGSSHVQVFTCRPASWQRSTSVRRRARAPTGAARRGPPATTRVDRRRVGRRRQSHAVGIVAATVGGRRSIVAHAERRDQPVGRRLGARDQQRRSCRRRPTSVGSKSGSAGSFLISTLTQHPVAAGVERRRRASARARQVGAAARRRSARRGDGVVVDDERAVGGAADVELDAVGALPVGAARNASRRVLRRRRGRAPVGDDEHRHSAGNAAEALRARHRIWPLSSTVRQRNLAAADEAARSLRPGRRARRRTADLRRQSRIEEHPTCRSLRPASPSAHADYTWRDDAICRDTDPDLFFPVGTTGPALVQIERAKAGLRRVRRAGRVPRLRPRHQPGLGHLGRHSPRRSAASIRRQPRRPPAPRRLTRRPDRQRSPADRSPPVSRRSAR